MNKKVIFWDIDKKSLDKIDNCKYVLLTNGNYEDIDITSFKIKPIIIAFNGSLIIDKENDKILNDEIMNNNAVKLVIDYFNKHDINYQMNVINKKIYQIKIESKNYYRMLILPMFIKNKFKNIKTSYGYPIKINKDLYQNYIISDKISTISNLNLIINYLNISMNNIFELSQMIDKINNNLIEFGYYKDFKVRKEYVNETKTKS